MNSTYRNCLFAVAALALGLGQTQARANLTLTVAQSGGPSISIDSTNGTYDFTGGAANKTYKFRINGDKVTFTTNGSGQFLGGTFADYSDTSVEFKADSANNSGGFTLTNFGDFKITTATASQSSPTTTESHIFDVTTDVGSTGSTNKTLTFTPTYSFTTPSSPKVKLQSSLAAATVTAGSVEFFSQIGATPTQTLTATTSGGPTLLTPFVVTTPGSIPYAVMNQLTIKGLGQGQTDNISATTNLLATPEPSSVAIALSAAPVLLLGALHRRRKAQV